MIFKLATHNELNDIMFLIEQAKKYLKHLNIDQWQNDYPNAKSIETDIDEKNGYILIINNEIIGYACVSFNQESCYEEIKGKWKTNDKYAVIHRMAIDNSYKNKGLASEMFSKIEKLCLKNGVYSIKVDTDNENSIMQHILEKNNFEYCGIIEFDGSPKIAFEKVLEVNKN